MEDFILSPFDDGLRFKASELGGNAISLQVSNVGPEENLDLAGGGV